MKEEIARLEVELQISKNKHSVQKIKNQLKNNRSYSCWKEYDIRGKLNIEINEEIAFRIGYSTAKTLIAKKVVVGYDARESSLNSQIQ